MTMTGFELAKACAKLLFNNKIVIPRIELGIHLYQRYVMPLHYMTCTFYVHIAGTSFDLVTSWL